ncbi:substrate-binding periplasmic protein [Chitinolyticbacter albus]|uniref:substrate-binding periplasmic protein n=1 Tax=Chitinolyticbacter albus TaxID=2961951 RepID=UPI00210BBDF1|nr:transporter substrate-binding domain-containing protein [Chitinolyticbacter albus]
MNPRPLSLAIVWMLLAAVVVPCASAAPLKMAHTAGMGYPLVTLSGQRVTGGLLKELGDLIAQQLGSKAQHTLFSRRRIEQALARGEADIMCYSSPTWSPQAVGGWTRHVLPQVERAVTLAEQPVPQRAPDDFVGKRIAVMLGYHFAPIQPLFDTGRATRLDDTRVENLFRRVRLGMADVLIMSEAEIEGYFRDAPAERVQYAIGKVPFSVVQTQCLVSPHSPWSVTAVNWALVELEQAGDIERLARRYGMSER